MRNWIKFAIACTYLASPSLIFAIPSVNEVQIMSVQANGTGCPVGSTTHLLVDTDGSGSADFFQVTFSEFYVERPGTFVKNCVVTAVLGIPNGWSFSIIDVAYDGFADIDQNHNGSITTRYNFPFFSNTVTTSKNLTGAFVGPYTKNDTLGLLAAVWSPCGRTAPLNMNTRISLSQKPRTHGGQSYLGVEVQSGLLTQIWGLRWRRC